MPNKKVLTVELSDGGIIGGPWDKGASALYLIQTSVRLGMI